MYRMAQEAIFNDAYEDTLKHLFKIFFEARLIAKNDTEREVAEDRFMTGARIARETRDRAVALLP
ncbi:hypothetical protein JIN84_08780 [Luteolibacter yonseiensis]|uniref:Uncharacterized protein n=1 Tax=Luteolibacter yonseiensis TaxID=1144680 RepID=A0A934VBR7_9BACT|nr:hypothetical protein [Luteolibacter yonseiensis]MBK1815709.1 hypothetical protein [Luteolibacter yonseiensis]